METEFIEMKAQDVTASDDDNKEDDDDSGSIQSQPSKISDGTSISSHLKANNGVKQTQQLESRLDRTKRQFDVIISRSISVELQCVRLRQMDDPLP